MALRNAFEDLSTEAKQDTLIAGIGAPGDAEASTGNGSLIGLLKRLRTLLAGGLPAALGGAGGVKVEQQGTVAVTGPLTDTQLRVSPVPVSGMVSVAEPVTVALDTATLAALETITSIVANWPSDFPDAAVLAKVEAVRALLAATLAVTGPLTDTQLRAAAVSVSGPLTDSELRASLVPVKDEFTGGQVLADQTGAGAVLTFTFASPVQLAVVYGDGLATDVARADPFGGTPSATLGIPCGDEVPTFLPVTTSAVKVFAPAGMVVSVCGYRRS